MDLAGGERASSATLELAGHEVPKGWVLEVQDEEGVKKVPLGRGRLVFGSHARTVDVTVRDRAVSGRHCAFQSADGALFVEDLGSKNGTFVGGARLTHGWVAPGTTVILGRSSVACLGASEVDGGTTDDSGEVPGLIGGSEAIRRVVARVRRLAALGAPVLVNGETGAGKELVARALHTEGPRGRGPFVVVNVAALPRELVESEMFGHERGAFTGAVTRRSGAFAEADGGTLFLDEVGELPLEAQPKLLRALDGYEVRAVGGAGSGRRANVRLVSATHVSLEKSVNEGRFRRDLFHRLEVFVVEVPPLRARRGDIAAIARHLLRAIAVEVGEKELSSAAVARLVAHDWPGNVRELRNVLYRAASESSPGGAILGSADVDRAIRMRERRGAVALTSAQARDLLDLHHGNLSAAARAANLPRTTFRKFLSPEVEPVPSNCGREEPMPRKSRFV